MIGSEGQRRGIGTLTLVVAFAWLGLVFLIAPVVIILIVSFGKSEYLVPGIVAALVSTGIERSAMAGGDVGERARGAYRQYVVVDPRHPGSPGPRPRPAAMEGRCATLL